MREAIAVLNAGSSSIKFSLFGGADLELVVRGQAEAIHTAPRFVAKDPAGATVSTRLASCAVAALVAKARREDLQRTVAA